MVKATVDELLITGVTAENIKSIKLSIGHQRLLRNGNYALLYAFPSRPCRRTAPRLQAQALV